MTRPIQLGVKGRAVFDAERRNRFLLVREWSKSLPFAAFCLTNPSDAGEDRDDPTSLKCQTYARLWGYGGIFMVNAFSWCATNPKFLYSRQESEEIVRRNFDQIIATASEAQLFIVGWGRAGQIDQRSKHVLSILTGFKLHALRTIKDGAPEHPLYLPLKLRPERYGVKEIAA